MTTTRRLMKSLFTLFLCLKTTFCSSFSHDQLQQETHPLPSSRLNDRFSGDSLGTSIPPVSCLPVPTLHSPLTAEDVYNWSLRIAGSSSKKRDIPNLDSIPVDKKAYILQSLELCKRLKREINKTIHVYQRLNISRHDDTLYKDLLEKIKSGYFDCDKDDVFFGLEEEKIDTYAVKMKELKEQKASFSCLPNPSEIYEEFHSVFDGKCFNSPIHSCGNSFLFPHGGTPPSNLTPRRKDNYERLWAGKAPLTICRNLTKEFKLQEEQNNHHLAQENQDIVLLLPKTLHKKHHGSLHINPNGRGLPAQENAISLPIQKSSQRSSKINRANFSTSKDRAYRLHSLQMTKNRILTYCEFHHKISQEKGLEPPSL